MKNTGLIDKNGKLLDHVRTREIRKLENEIKLNKLKTAAKFKDFNLKQKLTEHMNHLASKNLIAQAGSPKLIHRGS